MLTVWLNSMACRCSPNTCTLHLLLACYTRHKNLFYLTACHLRLPSFPGYLQNILQSVPLVHRHLLHQLLSCRHIKHCQQSLHVVSNLSGPICHVLSVYQHLQLFIFYVPLQKVFFSVSVGLDEQVAELGVGGGLDLDEVGD